MFYRAIGLMSGSSLDGLDIVFTELEETGGKWSYTIEHAECLPYSAAWVEKLRNAVQLNALDYMRLHTAYGHYIGEQVNRFVEKYHLHHRVQLIGSHGHTTFHEPHNKMTGQIGDGAAIAAQTGINVVSDLRAMDVALGGQGAPIVPIGEKLLLGDHQYFLNLGGIANLSIKTGDNFVAFDVCPANRVLNMLVQQMGHEFDMDGSIAGSGTVNNTVLEQLNALDYYQQPYPKSLANDFGTGIIYPMLDWLQVPDALATMNEHLAVQIAAAVATTSPEPGAKMLATGGGALNSFETARIAAHLQPLGVELVIPDKQLIEFKEALVMALMGVLRWREESNVLHTVTGAKRSSINGAVWIGQD